MIERRRVRDPYTGEVRDLSIDHGPGPCGDMDPLKMKRGAATNAAPVGHMRAGNLKGITFVGLSQSAAHGGWTRDRMTIGNRDA